MHELPGTGGNGLLAGALLWTCYAMMGALFAWVYRRTETLWAAIGAHAVNNLIACMLLLAGLHLRVVYPRCLTTETSIPGQSVPLINSCFPSSPRPPLPSASPE